MTRTVPDCAALLEAIAGPDGIDDRQPFNLPKTSYTTDLATFLSAPSDKPLSNIKIGILSEGLAIPSINPNILSLFHRSVETLATLGAAIHNISIPLHSEAAVVWMCSLPLSGAPTALLGDSMGRKQLHLNDREPATHLTQAQFDALGPGAQNLYMRYLYLKHTYGSKLHGKCANLLRKINVRPLFPIAFPILRLS